MNLKNVCIWLYWSAALFVTTIAVPAYADNSAETQMSEGIQLAGGGEIGAAEFYQTEHKWPAQLSDVYSPAGAKPAGKFVASVSGKGRGSTYVIQAVMRTDYYVMEALRGKSFVLWTTDGGNTWHCGTTGKLGMSGTINTKFLPPSCHE